MKIAMGTDIVFVNCQHEEFPYIPMGTFGLCDYLGQHELNARIVNLSLYSKEESCSLLVDEISELQPKYIGLILHWKELLNSVIQTGSLLRKRFPHIPIITGGMTASCYTTELMKNLKFIDYLIKGESEVPLLHILKGLSQPESIDNLVIRRDGYVIHNPLQFQADESLLNSISFSRLDFLKDYPLYVERLNQYLGFPIFIGRGCAFDCEYCGGSRSAFQKHSGRYKLTVRSKDRIIQDLLTLVERYKCDHILLSHFTALCKPILYDLFHVYNLSGRVRLNLEVWDHPDKELFELHEAVVRGAPSKACIILTPKDEETEIGHLNWSYDKAKNPSTNRLSIHDMIDLAQYCHIDIFKGYFTSKHKIIDLLFQEMKQMHDIRRQYSNADLSVHFLSFSTDPASRLSESNSDIQSDISLEAINKAILFDRNLSTNILLHSPRSISHMDQEVFKRILFFSEFLYRNAPLVYWLLTEEMGFPRYLDIINCASQYYFYEVDNSHFEISPSNSLLALNCIKTSLSQNSVSKPLILEALKICIKHAVSTRLLRLYNRKANFLPDYLTLNDDRILISDFNFEKLFQEVADSGSIDKSLITYLEEKREPSLYLLTDNNINRLPIEEFSILEMFDGIHETKTIAETLVTLKNATYEWVIFRIKELYEQDVLIES